MEIKTLRIMSLPLAHPGRLLSVATSPLPQRNGVYIRMSGCLNHMNGRDRTYMGAPRTSYTFIWVNLRIGSRGGHGDCLISTILTGYFAFAASDAFEQIHLCPCAERHVQFVEGRDAIPRITAGCGMAVDIGFWIQCSQIKTHDRGNRVNSAKSVCAYCDQFFSDEKTARILVFRSRVPVSQSGIKGALNHRGGGGRGGLTQEQTD